MFLLDFVLIRRLITVLLPLLLLHRAACGVAQAARAYRDRSDRRQTLQIETRARRACGSVWRANECLKRGTAAPAPEIIERHATYGMTTGSVAV